MNALLIAAVMIQQAASPLSSTQAKKVDTVKVAASCSVTEGPACAKKANADTTKKPVKKDSTKKPAKKDSTRSRSTGGWGHGAQGK